MFKVAILNTSTYPGEADRHVCTCLGRAFLVLLRLRICVRSPLLSVLIFFVLLGLLDESRSSSPLPIECEPHLLPRYLIHAFLSLVPVHPTTSSSLPCSLVVA